MTTVVEYDSGVFYVNNPAFNYNAATLKFWLRDEYSQKYLGPLRISSVTQTDRYARILVDFPADFDENHKNGFYTYYIGNGDEEQPGQIFEQDIVKIITNPGGASGKTEYISNNETREADVYYRPNY